MELKANCIDYRKHQGADTVNEFVQALKYLSYDPETLIDVLAYNPQTTAGYMGLIEIQVKSVPVVVVLDNRMDFLSDGKTLNGYEKIRKWQIE